MDDAAGAVFNGGTATDPFEFNHEVKHGCVLVHTLFTLILAAVLLTVSEDFSAVCVSSMCVCLCL